MTSEQVHHAGKSSWPPRKSGITEVANARDEEFGPTRLQELLTRHATRALPEIWDLIMSEVRQYGLQQDDQSLLLLRVLDPAIPLAT